MRLPFFDPGRDKVAAAATDLITRFGLRAHEEALYLAGLSAQMRSRRDRVLYELRGPRNRCELSRSAKAIRPSSKHIRFAAHVLPREGHQGGADRAREGTELPKLGRAAPRIPPVSRAADTPTSLVADLNLVDTKPSPRRRFGSR